MSLNRYLQLLDWTGRQLKADKRGSTPPGFDPMLERQQFRELAGSCEELPQTLSSRDWTTSKSAGRLTGSHYQ